MRQAKAGDSILILPSGTSSIKHFTIDTFLINYLNRDRFNTSLALGKKLGVFALSITPSIVGFRYCHSDLQLIHTKKLHKQIT